MTTRIRLFRAVVGRRGTLTAADRRLIRDIMPRTVARRHLWPKK